jgi:hypothetical protein
MLGIGVAVDGFFLGLLEPYTSPKNQKTYYKFELRSKWGTIAIECNEALAKRLSSIAQFAPVRVVFGVRIYQGNTYFFADEVQLARQAGSEPKAA